jgi:hypothetical protein
MKFPNVIIMCSCYQQFILCFAASDGQELARIQKVKIIRNSKREGEWSVVYMSSNPWNMLVIKFWISGYLLLCLKPTLEGGDCLNIV